MEIDLTPARQATNRFFRSVSLCTVTNPAEAEDLSHEALDQVELAIRSLELLRSQLAREVGSHVHAVAPVHDLSIADDLSFLTSSEHHERIMTLALIGKCQVAKADTGKACGDTGEDVVQTEDGPMTMCFRHLNKWKEGGACRTS